MITKEDIIRIFKYLDDYGIPLENKDLETIETKLNIEVQQVQRHINDKRDASTPPIELEPLFKESVAAYTQNHKAFLQTFALPVSDEIRAMVYFITMENAAIQSLNMDYISKEQFSLKIKLKLRSNKEVSFHSNTFWDAEIIRHFGIMMMNDKPLFTGYLPI